MYDPYWMFAASKPFLVYVENKLRYELPMSLYLPTSYLVGRYIDESRQVCSGILFLVSTYNVNQKYPLFYTGSPDIGHRANCINQTDPL